MKRFLAAAMALLMLFSATACQQTQVEDSTSTSQSTDTADTTDTSDGEHAIDYEFEIFRADPGFNVPPHTGEVTQQVEAATGVRLNYTVASAGSAADRLNVMLASSELPDAIFFDKLSSVMLQYIEAGKLLPLNALLEANAPHVLEVNWADVGPKIQDEDGNYYYFPQQYAFSVDNIKKDSNESFNIRTAHFEEVGYENIPQTLQEYEDMLMEVKDKYPDMYPLSLALGPQGHLEEIAVVGSAVNGIAVEFYLNAEDGKVRYVTQIPEMKEWYRYLSGLNQKGLLDPEAPILSKDLLKEKSVAGEVWSFIGDGWPIRSEVIAYEMSQGSDEQMIDVYIKKDDTLEVGTYSQFKYNLYETGTSITTSCEFPEAFVEFYGKINTEETFLKTVGVVAYEFEGENTIEETEGYDFISPKDLEYMPGRSPILHSAWLGDMWAQDENWWWNRGLGQYSILTSGEYNYPDGKFQFPGDRDVSVWWDENTARIWEERGITGTSWLPWQEEMGIDISEFTGLTLDPDSEAYLISVNAKQTVDKYLPRAIMAESDAEFEQHWTEMEAELDQIGIDVMMQGYQEAYDMRN